MKIGYYSENNTHYLYDSYGIDTNGNLYIIFVSKPGYIKVFNKNLDLIDEIDIRHLTKRNSSGWFLGLFITQDNLIVLGTRNEETIVIDKSGNKITQYPKISKENYYGEKLFARDFIQFSNGQIMIINGNNSYGNLIALSKEKHPSFKTDSPFETFFINDTYSHLFDQHDLILNMDNSNHSQSITIGKYLFQKMELYYKNKSQNRIYINHPQQPSIHEVVELDSKRILVLVASNYKGKSAYPDKNMPYYFFILDKFNGKILKEISPNDRTNYKENIASRIVRYDQNKLLFKTYENLHILDLNCNFVDVISLKERIFSNFRSLILLGKWNDVMYFANNLKGQLVTFPFQEDDLKINLLNMMKEYKIVKKANK